MKGSSFRHRPAYIMNIYVWHLKTLPNRIIIIELHGNWSSYLDCTCSLDELLARKGRQHNAQTSGLGVPHRNSWHIYRILKKIHSTDYLSEHMWILNAILLLFSLFSCRCVIQFPSCNRSQFGLQTCENIQNRLYFQHILLFVLQSYILKRKLN